MAIYRVLLDGVDIYDPTSKGMVLIDPVVHTEAGAAGNFEFTMPPMHVFYNSVTPYGSSIEVLEDGQSIFFGRPLKPKIGFYNQKTYHCEGALAFLNDSRPTDEFVYENTTPAQYFRDLIAYHNSFQSKDSRKFTVGNITVSTDWDVYREMSPSMTIMEHIKRGCVGSDGGYLFTRRVNGVTYIDWMKDMPYTCNQTVEFSLNLLDMSRSGNEDIYTGVMLKGGERKIRQNGRVSNSVVKYGPMWGSAEAIAKYGEIMAYQEYPDIDNVDNLIAAGEYFLMTQQFESMLFEVSAAEQHYLNVSLDAFEAGQKVHLVSNPHFVDIELPVQSIEVRLDSAEKKVTLGTVKRQTLTKIQRKTKEEQEIKDQKIEELTNALDIVENDVGAINNDIGDIHTDIGDLQDNQGIIVGDDGNRYKVGVDENGNVYAEKLLNSMYIAQLPTKTGYIETESYDWTGLIVMAEYGDGVGVDITADCTVIPASGTQAATEGKGEHDATVLYTEASGYETHFGYTVIGQNEEPPNLIESVLTLAKCMEFAQAFADGGTYNYMLINTDSTWTSLLSDPNYNGKPCMVSCGSINGWNNIIVKIALDLEVGDLLAEKMTRIETIEWNVYAESVSLRSRFVSSESRLQDSNFWTYYRGSYQSYKSGRVGSINMI